VAKQVNHHSNVGRYQIQRVASTISLDMKLLLASKIQKHVDAQVVDQDDEDQMFMATCFSTKSFLECWLIDGSYTNHITYDRSLFKDLKPTRITKVRIGNGGYIPAKKRKHCNYSKLRYKDNFKCSLITTS
jgi:hypothetical protein